MTTKTMSIRMDRDNYEFLSAMTMEEKSDLSKAVRDLVTRGRILLAVEKYRKGEASLGKAAEVAGAARGTDDDAAWGIRSAEQDRRGRLSPESGEPSQSLVVFLPVEVRRSPRSPRARDPSTPLRTGTLGAVFGRRD